MRSSLFNHGRSAGLVFSMVLGVGALAAACGTDDPASDAQSPPTTGHTELQAWLARGAYKDWTCEPAVHDARSPSPHGKNRICSNDLASAHGDGPYPIGAASVKELYDDAGAQIVGYAVGLKVSADTTGAGWYWYENVPLDHPAPHDDRGVVADGIGSSGAALDICVGCHVGAGADAQHSGHDFVYTQVR